MAAAAAPALKAEVRDNRGKEWAKKARKSGSLPAIMYGSGIDSIALAINTHQFALVRQQVHGESVLINLELSNGSNERVFIKDVQRDPVTWEPLHVDFLRVDPTKPVNLTVPIRQVGSPVGLKEGGMMERVRDQVQVAALPDKVPGHIDADVSALAVGQTLHVSDLPKLEGVTYLDAPDTALYTVLGKTKEEPAPGAAPAAPATPAP